MSVSSPRHTPSCPSRKTHVRGSVRGSQALWRWSLIPVERSLSVASISSTAHSLEDYNRLASGSDAMLDNAHVAEDYLARTPTMYRIIAMVRNMIVMKYLSQSLGR